MSIVCPAPTIRPPSHGDKPLVISLSINGVDFTEVIEVDVRRPVIPKSPTLVPDTGSIPIKILTPNGL